MLYISTGVLCHKLRTLPYFQKYWITSAIEMPTQALENPINILRPNSSKADSGLHNMVDNSEHFYNSKTQTCGAYSETSTSSF